MKVVIGIDQSYTKTGISIAVDGVLKTVTSIDFKGISIKSEKRKILKETLYRLLTKVSKKASEVVIIIERIRTFSNFGQKGKSKNAFGQGLKPDYLKMTGALVAVIVDVAYEFGINVYSVDTRAWKSKVVGSSKARKKDGKRDAKSETVEFVTNLGFDLYVRTDRNGKDLYDDDAADSACIALYGFIPKKLQNLKLEE